MNQSTVNEERETSDVSMVLGKPVQALQLCFLSCIKDGAHGFVGGVLVTDFRTIPLEFTYVSPIRPTTMQRVLYGKTLDEYVMVDAISKKLIEGLAHKPDIVFVDNLNMLPCQRIFEVPVAYISKLQQHESTKQISTVTFRGSEGSGFEDSISQTISVLEPMVNLWEPFDRITEAVKETLKSKS